MIASEVAATLNPQNAAERAQEYIKTIEPYPNRFRGRGIVTCAGGLKYNPSAWVLIKMLRKLGCQLPIQVWHLGREERDEAWTSLVKPFDVECIDAHEIRKQHPHPRLGGWESKPYAILHSPFEEVLFLDADNVPVHDPTYLFDDPRYRATGAAFWPDGGRTPPGSDRWRIFGVEYRDEPDQESGQVLINKKLCWSPLNLCNWYNEHSDFFYRFIYGDKDTFCFAWRRLDQQYAMPNRGTRYLPYTICQHDFEGRRLFQHRCGAKWLLGRNRHIEDFELEDDCLQFLRELQNAWNPMPLLTRHLAVGDRRHMGKLVGRRFKVVCSDFEDTSLILQDNGLFVEGRSGTVYFWWIKDETLFIATVGGRPAVRLERRPGGSWIGNGIRNPELTVRLIPSPHGVSRHGSSRSLIAG